MRYGFKEVVIDSRTGLNPRKNFVLGNGENNYITIKDIYNGQINITDKTDKVDDDAIQIIKKRSRIKAGDILFVSIGRIGETAIVTTKDDTWDVNESVFVFTINRDIITPEYFCMLFQSDAVQKFLTGNSSGSTFKSIKMNQLEKMIFDLPPLKDQENITTKISKVKALCDLRASELAQLDRLIKARFVEMFGSVKEECILGDISEFVTVGIANSATYAYAESGIPMLRNQNIKENYLDDSDLIYIKPEFAAQYESKKLKENDIIAMRTGYPGIACLVPKKYEGCQTFTTLIVRLKEGNNPRYVCSYINSDLGKRFIDSGKVGVAQQNFGAKSLAKMPIKIASKEMQDEYAELVTRVDKSKAAVQAALDKAQLLFDSLMQQYFG